MQQKETESPAVVRGDGVCLDAAVLRHCGLAEGERLVVEPATDGLLLLPARPDAKRLYLEPTSRCNLACAACMRHGWDEEPGDMSDDVFAAVVAQVAALPRLETAHLAGFGEPLAHPKVFDMLAALGSRGLRTEMTTNGLLLDAQRARLAVEVGLHTIVVSVDGASADTHAAARAGCDLGEVLANVRRLQEERRARQSPLPKVGFEFVATRENREEFPALLDLVETMHLDFLFATNVLPYDQSTVDAALYGEKALPVGASAWHYWHWGVDRLRLPRTEVRTDRYCRFVERNSLVVAWDGVVSPCYAFMHGHTEYVLGRRKQVKRWSFGDVRERPLAEIWTDPEYVRFRSRVRRAAFPSCVDCQQADACYFSQGNEEDCWGNTPSCGDCLWARGLIQCY